MTWDDLLLWTAEAEAVFQERVLIAKAGEA